MKKKKYILFVAILGIAIGFAAVSATLYLNGRTDIGVNQKDFDVYFSEAILDGEDKSGELISADKKSIIYEITNLQKVGDISHLNYEITNNSSQYDLDIQLSCEGNNDLIDYVNQLDQTRISAKAKEKGVLTVQLKQTVLEETTVTFTCQINASAVERTEANNTEIPKTGNKGLSGTLVDNDKQSIPNQTIVVIGNGIHPTTTDNLGNFYVDGLEDGELEIIIINKPLDEIKDLTEEEIRNNAIDTGKIKTEENPDNVQLENGNFVQNITFEDKKNEKITITLNVGDGSLEQTTIEVTKNQKFGELPTPTKDGYQFLGWYVKDQLITPDTIVTGNIDTLEAKYARETITVTFDANGGTVSPESILVEVDGTYGNIPYPSRENYTFHGWYYEGTAVSPSKKVLVNEDHTVVAAWTENRPEVTAKGYEGDYDGFEHSITVTSDGDATITYSTDGQNYTSENPKFVNVGTYTVYYKVKLANAFEESGSETVKINKGNNKIVLSAPRGEITYPETTAVEVRRNDSGEEITVSSSDTDIAVASISGGVITLSSRTKEGVAEISISTPETDNYKATTVVYQLTVKNGTLDVEAQGYEGIYDGNSHSIIVTTNLGTIEYSTDNENFSSEKPTFTEGGEHTIYYRVSEAGYKTVTGSKQVIITKADNSLILSSSEGSLTYPNALDFTVERKSSSEVITASSSNEAVATASVEDATVTVNPGTTEGVAIITVTSSGTNNYKEAVATYTATVEHGTLDIVANNYVGAYNGSAHSITVTANEGATIKYGTVEGTYNLTTPPTYINSGTYTVYYQVTKEGYKTETGSRTVEIFTPQPLYDVLQNEATSGGVALAYTGSHQDSMSGVGSKTIYHYYATTDDEGTQVQDKNNVVFANYCWQMIRTTDTGGVKLLYNGIPTEDGKCSTDRKQAFYNRELGCVTASLNFAYGSDFTYDESTNKYKLAGDIVVAKWSDETSKDLIGKYSCREYSADATCSSLYYADSYNTNYCPNWRVVDRIHYSSMARPNYPRNVTLSSTGYMYNTKYAPKSKSTSTAYKYGNSFTYANGKYTLSGTTITTTVSYNDLKNIKTTHYTCFDENGVCETIAYVYAQQGSTAYYIELQGGKNIENAVYEMLHDSNVNKYDSIYKYDIERWYEEKMTNYTKYLEDTIFCNDRTISKLGGWDPNGDGHGNLFFKEYSPSSYAPTKDLSCSNVTDRFSISNAKAKIKYPVGLPTAPELNLLNNNNARKTDSSYDYMTMSPAIFYQNYSKFIGVRGNSIGSMASGGSDIRPMVSLKPGIKYRSGNGSTEKPYVIYED